MTVWLFYEAILFHVSKLLLFQGEQGGPSLKYQRQKLIHFLFVFRRPFPLLHRQFSDLVDSVSDQIISYHDNVISMVILQDARSNNWSDSRPFFEVIMVVITWNTYCGSHHCHTWLRI